ncbi:MAG: hypothetical protein F6K11_15630 [Leptolyngbya sp. SIO3F4]|nr:hypothetical protein [Leptolyngbya sp. SIO3F4]
MSSDIPIQPTEQTLLEFLNAKQLTLVAEWLISEKELRKDEGYHTHVEESLESMAYRIQWLAQLKNEQP